MQGILFSEKTWSIREKKSMFGIVGAQEDV